MAKIPANATKHWLDEFVLHTEISGFTQDITQETPVVTTLGDVGPRRVVANHDMADQFLGFFDGDGSAGLPDEEFWNILGDNSAIHWFTKAMGSAIGDPAYTTGIALGNQPRSGAIGGAVLLNFDGAGQAPISRDRLLANSTSTGAESLTGVNQGATTSGQSYRAVFRLIAFTGTSVTMTIEESTDNGGGDAYAAIGSLNSGAMSAPGVVSVTITTATEAWKRVALSGTYSSATIAVSAGLLAGE